LIASLHASEGDHDISRLIDNYVEKSQQNYGSDFEHNYKYEVVAYGKEYFYVQFWNPDLSHPLGPALAISYAGNFVVLNSTNASSVINRDIIGPTSKAFDEFILGLYIFKADSEPLLIDKDMLTLVLANCGKSYEEVEITEEHKTLYDTEVLTFLKFSPNEHSNYFEEKSVFCPM